jgi:hypothetical protein
MRIQKTGRIDSWGPKIFLGSAAGDIASVCLTAPDKAADFAGQTRHILARDILGVIDDLLGQMGSGQTLHSAIAATPGQTSVPRHLQRCWLG